MTDHTTHFDDCGCKSARLERRVAELEAYIFTARQHLHSTDEQSRVSATVLLDSTGEPTALKALLVRAANDGRRAMRITSGNTGLSYSVTYTDTPEAIAERILKEGR